MPPAALRSDHIGAALLEDILRRCAYALRCVGFDHVGKLFEDEDIIADAALRAFVRTTLQVLRPAARLPAFMGGGLCVRARVCGAVWWRERGE